MVAANIDTSKVPALDGLYKPHIIVERKGRKIGIIGLITEETAVSIFIVSMEEATLPTALKGGALN